MGDPRVEAYAKLLVERCLDVQPGWQVLLRSTPLARPLLEEITRLIARRGAYVLLRLNFSPSQNAYDPIWAKEAPEELVRELAPIERHDFETADAAIVVVAPENTRDGSDIDPGRLALIAQAREPALRRVASDELPWVGCYYPTLAAAQEAGMTLEQFSDFVYEASLIDWDALRERMQRILERLDSADEIRITAPGTDLTLSLAGRRGEIDAGNSNMPGGEVFFSPVEDSAQGEIAFEYPALRGGFVVENIRLRFDSGRIVEASASHDEEYLLATLDTDEGARRLGELGVGCNPAIQRFIRNTLFDEKIEGTVHLAIGLGFQKLGGTNQSAIHWDFVKEMRNGGELSCDGEVVQRDGRWLI